MTRKYTRRSLTLKLTELRPGRKRISVDIPTSLHELLWEASERNNCTITVYVIRSLRDRLKKEGIDA
jgi:hypothetical protein